MLRKASRLQRFEPKKMPFKDTCAFQHLVESIELPMVSMQIANRALSFANYTTKLDETEIIVRLELFIYSVSKSRG